MKLVKAKTRIHWKEIHKLYEAAFPSYEKKPFWLIRLKNKQGRADVWHLEDEGKFIGLAITMSSPELVLLDYFAIDESLRGKGFGSESLKALQKQYEDRHFFLEIESIYDECPNVEQRLRRKQFYLKNGMTEMKMMANLFGTNMEVLGHGCKLDFDTYRSIYEYAYGKKVVKNVTEVSYPQTDMKNK